MRIPIGAISVRESASAQRVPVGSISFTSRQAAPAFLAAWARNANVLIGVPT